MYEDRGVIYYLGFNDPSENDAKLISLWQTLPVVKLLYDGPNDLASDIVSCMNKKGVLTGSGDLFYVKLRVSQNVYVMEVAYRDMVYSNSMNPGRLDKLGEEFERVLETFFGVLALPEEGYLVKIVDGTPEIKRVQNLTVPVKLEFERKLYRVKVLDQTFLVEEGFHDFLGKTVYVNQDMEISPVNFFPDVEMVYKTQQGFFSYRDNKLFSPDGKVMDVQEPFEVTFDGQIIQKRYTLKLEGNILTSSVIGRYRNLLIFASGIIAPLDLSWAMKVSGPVVEWCASADKLLILDLSSHLRIVDVSGRRIVLEKHLPFAWGLATDHSYVYVGVGEKIVKMNFNGAIIEQFDGKNFGVWKNDLHVIKDNRQILRDGDVFAVFEDTKAEIFAKTVHNFDNVRRVRFFDWGIVVHGSVGCWVVER